MRVGLWALTAPLISSVLLAGAQGERNRSLTARSVNWSKHPAIQYHATATADPVAKLIQDVDAGRVQLHRDGPSGYLRSVLDALHVPVASQIYSAQFDALPATAQAAIYQRMWQVLSGRDHDPACDRLSADTRAATVEILRATKPALPQYFRTLRLK